MWHAIRARNARRASPEYAGDALRGTFEYQWVTAPVVANDRRTRPLDQVPKNESNDDHVIQRADHRQALGQQVDRRDHPEDREPYQELRPMRTRESLRRPRSKAARSGRSVASCRASTLRPVTTSAATAMSHTAAAIPRATKRLCTSRDYGAVGTGGDDVSARPSRGCRSCPARALGQPRTPPRPTRRARAR